MPIPGHLTAPAAGGRHVQLDRSGGAPPPEDDVLQVEPGHPWFFVHYPHEPTAWFVAEITGEEGDPYVGTWWLPRLQTLISKPGVCGHRTKKRGQDMARTYGDAHNRVREQGGVILPHALGYLVEKDCVGPLSRNPGKAYIDAWSEPRAKLPRKRQKFTFDRQRYYRWLLTLLWEGVIPAPTPDIVDERTARLADRVHRRETQDHGGDDERKAALVAEAAARLEAATEAQVAEEIPRARPTPPARKTSARSRKRDEDGEA